MAANPPSGSQPQLRPDLDPLPAGYGTFFAKYIADYVANKSAFFFANYTAKYTAKYIYCIHDYLRLLIYDS